MQHSVTRKPTGQGSNVSGKHASAGVKAFLSMLHWLEINMEIQILLMIGIKMQFIHSSYKGRS